MWKLFRTARQKVDGFRQSHERQTDDEFIRHCRLPDDPLAEQAALAVRHAVANIGLVDARHIHPDDDYPGSLEALPLWESMDWAAFLVELETEIGTEILDAALATFTVDPVTVRDLVVKLYEFLKSEVEQP